MRVDQAIGQFRKVKDFLDKHQIVLPQLDGLIVMMEEFQATPVVERTNESLDELKWMVRVVKREVAQIRRRYRL